MTSNVMLQLELWAGVRKYNTTEEEALIMLSLLSMKGQTSKYVTVHAVLRYEGDCPGLRCDTLSLRLHYFTSLVTDAS